MSVILTLNAGSSTLKYAVHRELAGTGTLQELLREKVEGTGGTAVERVLDLVDERLAGEPLTAVGHRVVHGGPRFDAPVRIDPGVLSELEALTPLAPLHQPHGLAVIRAVTARLPSLPQVACFDTAFHRGHPLVSDVFAIPLALHEEGIRRYGFHGLSYESIASRLPEVAPEIADGRVVVAHLGNGASLCALAGRKSVDSTMSFTALDGLPMGTRCGNIDPGVLLYLLEARGYDVPRLSRLLYQESGLLGLSGTSSDMRELLEDSREGPRLAVDVFAHRVVKEIGALAAVLGGLDALVFTGGIGENATSIRARVCGALAWLGPVLDPEANSRGGPRITRSKSRLAAFVIPADEERMIARHTLDATR